MHVVKKKFRSSTMLKQKKELQPFNLVLYVKTSLNGYTIPTNLSFFLFV